MLGHQGPFVGHNFLDIAARQLPHTGLRFSRKAASEKYDRAERVGLQRGRAGAHRVQTGLGGEAEHDHAEEHRGDHLGVVAQEASHLAE